MLAMKKLLMKIEIGYHMVDAYLYSWQDKQIEASDALCRAYDIERRITHLEINHG